MATKSFFFILALFCSAKCNPLCPLPPALGSTTVCETSPNSANLLGLGYSGLSPLPYAGGLGVGLSGLPLVQPSTTVCETSPNVGLGLPYGLPLGLNGLGYGGLNGLAYGGLPMQGLGYGGLGLSLAGTTSICESTPNLGYGMNVLPYYGLGSALNIPVGTSTVCESVPNVNCGCNGIPLPYGNYGSTSVCETVPNSLGYSNVGLPLAGSSTVCETTPNIGLGLSRNLPLLPIGYPYPLLNSGCGCGGLNPYTVNPLLNPLL